MPVSTAKTQRNAHRVSIRILVWMDLKKFGAVCTLDIIHMSRTIKFEHSIVVAEVSLELILVVVLSCSASRLVMAEHPLHW